MSEVAQTTIVFLLEHELRTAAAALRRFHDSCAKDSAATEEERAVACGEAVNAATAALWGADALGAALMLTSATHILAPSARKVLERDNDGPSTTP